MRILRVIYVLAIAGLLIALVVAGVEAFYPEPEYSGYPGTLDEYRRESAARDRNILFIILPLGAVLTLAGTFIRRRLDIFGAGLILGGMGTMIFSIVPSDLAGTLRFIGIAVALALLLFVGYKVFLSPKRS
jgi:hypothetical protein